MVSLLVDSDTVMSAGADSSTHLHLDADVFAVFCKHGMAVHCLVRGLGEYTVAVGCPDFSHVHEFNPKRVKIPTITNP